MSLESRTTTDDRGRGEGGRAERVVSLARDPADACPLTPALSPEAGEREDDVRTRRGHSGARSPTSASTYTHRPSRPTTGPGHPYAGSAPRSIGCTGRLTTRAAARMNIPSTA